MALSFIPKLEALSPQIFRVLGCNPGPYTLQGTNTYLVGSNKSRILIDTGSEDVPEYIQNLKEGCKQIGCTLEDIGTIVCTHWHHDHVGGLKAILKARGNSSPVRVVKFWRVNEPEEQQFLPPTMHYEYLNDQQTINIAGISFRFLYTPGHTTDHMCVYMQEQQALFTGDCILGETSAVFEDLADYMSSLKSLLAYKIDRIYPGHGPVIENPTAKIQEYIDHRNLRESQILQVIQKKNVTDLDTIVDCIYQDLSPPIRIGALTNVEHHLKKLVKEGLVVKMDGQDKWKAKL